jgi:iron complex outermembrane receptor protein
MANLFNVTKLGLFLRSGTALTLALAAGQVSAADTASAADAVDQSEIVVTAQKREQKLQDVGIAISVLG